MAAPLTAPRTSFNGTITGHRTVGMVDMSLDDIKAVKTATGATVNDVVLAVAGGALRSYLLDRDELPESSLLATVPMSVRETSKRETGANKVSALFTRLGTDLEDPLERLEELAPEQPARQGPRPGDQRRLAPGLGGVRRAPHLRPRGPRVRRPAARREAPGRAQPGDLQRARAADPALLHGRRDQGARARWGRCSTAPGVNVTVMSNNGKVHVGIIACRESMPDVDDLAQRFPAELAKLKAAVALDKKPTPIRKKAAARRPDRKPAQTGSAGGGLRKSRRRALTVAAASTNAGTNTSDSSTHAA